MTTEQELDAAKFAIIGRSLTTVAAAVGYGDRMFGEWLEHREYGIAFEELRELVEGSGADLTANQSAILRCVELAMYSEDRGCALDDRLARCDLAHEAGTLLIQERVTTGRSVGIRMADLADFRHAVDDWTASRH